MADINKYLDGLNMKFSNQEKQLLDIFAECWNYCNTHSCNGCEYMQGNERMKIMICTAYQYAKRLIAANVAPTRCGEWKERNNVFECSNRGYCFKYEGYKQFFHFCPNCGAKMDF